MGSHFHLNWVEWSVVAAMLLLSTLVGVYYTFFKKQKTYDEYMFGNKSMGVFPVATSVLLSFISAVALMGMPVEIYLYGTQYFVALLAQPTLLLFYGIFFLPVFHKLQLASMYKYLELRFNKRVRIVGTLLYSLSMVITLPPTIYAPSLFINQVTGISVYTVAPVILLFCICYTAFGGLKAVVWTDTLQGGFMLAAVLVLAVLGCTRLGGLQEILRINEEGNRLDTFNMDPSPFTRCSFINFFIGLFFLYLSSLGLNPGMVQRYLAVSSLNKARLVLVFTAIGYLLLVFPMLFLGLILYARYYQCDPVASGELKTHNQMMPLYLMEISKDYPGLAGLFLSGILSAALSTISSWLNTAAGTLYKDVMEVFFPRVHHSESRQSNIIKSLVATLGINCLMLVFIVERLGSLLQLSNSMIGIVSGSLTCLFSLGVFFPRVNSKGAISGTVVCLVMCMWITFNAQYYIMHGKLQFPGKMTSIDHCPTSITDHYTANSSLLFSYRGVGSQIVADSSVPLLYRINHFYYSVLSILCGSIVGVVVSLLTEPPDYTTMNTDLFSPYVHRFLPDSVRSNKGEYELTVQKDDGVLDTK